MRTGQGGGSGNIKIINSLNTKNPRILISRTDAIGDVTLTLPMCGYLKHLLPHAKIIFLGRTYTAPVIACSESIDEFLNYDEIKALEPYYQIDFLKSKAFDIILHVFPNKEIASLARKAGIPVRIGTLNRVYHWFTCNKLIKLSRRNSLLHEAQLNIIFLKSFGLKTIPLLNDLAKYYNFIPPDILPEAFIQKINKDKFNLIIHPKSHGSGKEWSLDNYASLIKQLPEQAFQIIVTGSQKEKVILKDWISSLPKHVIDLTGQMTLSELISFISRVNGLLAAGTGPLHLSALAGIHTLGLFPKDRAINAKRWAPIGNKAEFIESTGNDLNEISPESVCRRITLWAANQDWR